MFKVGFSTLGCPEYTVQQVVDLASTSGYDGVELRFIRGVVDLSTLEEFAAGQLAQTRKIFDDAGIVVNCIDTSERLGVLWELLAARRAGGRDLGQPGPADPPGPRQRLKCRHPGRVRSCPDRHRHRAAR